MQYSIIQTAYSPSERPEMEIKHFALGVRFDSLEDSVSPEFIETVFDQLTSLLTVRDVEDLIISSGVCRLREDENDGVYTVVFTNGNLKKMRALYSKIDSDARLHAMLETRTPFIQNNIIRAFDGLEQIGIVAKNGRCVDGDGRAVVFPERVEARPLFNRSKTVLVALSSFKGTISGDTAAKHLMRAVRRRMPDVTCIPAPAADGGDGTLSAVEMTLLGQRHGMDVTGPYGKKVRAEYLVVDGTKAIIESALASGLALSSGEELDPLKATSFGTGQLILRAAHEGIHNILVCLGGSATNDCGIGMARAIGVKFLASDGTEIDSASRMKDIASIDVSAMDKQVKEADIIAVCDVKNPLTGEHGATFTYGPQKGANEDSLAILEEGMLNMERLLNAHHGSSVCSEAGAGAAGGMGAMLMALFNAKVVPGAEALLDAAEFGRKLKNASLVITGEGRIDSTSLEGKALGAVIRRANSAGVPVAILAGSRGEGYEKVEALANFCEYSLSEQDALKHFDEAATRLAEKIAEIF